VVVCAAGSAPGDLHKLWRARDPAGKGYHVEYGYSCMGYEIAGALGAKMADPSREVYVMVGDGSYLMLNGEIVTSLQEGYKLTIVLVDNGGFQCIRGLQESSGSPSFGNELRFRDLESGRLDGPYIPIDFAKHAKSLGAVAFTADSPPSLSEALQQAGDETRTVLIHVRADVDARVPSYDGWWDVPVAEASGEASIDEARRVYDRAKRKQRFYY
jgi:3D-(3,5/4)-trihydroxycyclohexane-1,2-dione acylhydrolase (decyclizing)